MKGISAICSAITENTESILVKCTPQIRESHNASISAMSNSFHNIVSKRSASAIFMSHTEAITCLPTLHGFEERMGDQRGIR